MEKRGGVMVDTNISRKLKGKVLDSFVVPASSTQLVLMAWKIVKSRMKWAGHMYDENKR